MYRWYELVLAAEDDIATIMTMEGGKPLKESKGEFASGYLLCPVLFSIGSCFAQRSLSIRHFAVVMQCLLCHHCSMQAC